MLYKRMNKSGNSMELLDIDSIHFVRAKLEDRLYKTIIILCSGEKVHMNLTQPELDKLCRKVQLRMEGSKIPYTDSPIGELVQSSPKKPISIDSMLDDLKTDPVISAEDQE